PPPTLFPYTTLFRSEVLERIAPRAGRILVRARIGDLLVGLAEPGASRCIGNSHVHAQLLAGRFEDDAGDIDIERLRIFGHYAHLDRKSTRLNSSHVK